MSTYESILELAVSSAVALVQHLPNDELKLLLNDEGKLDELVKDLPQVKQQVTEKEMLITQNKSLAEFNLQQEPKLKEAKEQLLQSYEEACRLKEKVEAKKAQLDRLSENRSLDTTLALLQAAASEADEESDAVKNRFLAGSVTVDQFLDDFLPKRSKAHLRRIKVEKMRELMHSAPTAGSNGAGNTETRSGNSYWPQSQQTKQDFTYWNSGYQPPYRM